MMENCPPEQALWLRQLAIECLDATQSQDQHGWGEHMGFAWGGHLGIAKKP